MTTTEEVFANLLCLAGVVIFSAFAMYGVKLIVGFMLGLARSAGVEAEVTGDQREPT